MYERNADEELQVEAEQRVGLVLRDKWRLDCLIGVGGMGAVYAATHRNGNRGAVKVLHAALTLSREIRTRFMREGYAANQVNHPGVVQVIDDDEDQGMVFLVMELLEGENLEERWLRNGSRLPAAEVLSIADQVLDVLAAAHDKGIVHRDLKPENLFLTKEGRVKVLDFGIARLRHASTSPRTKTGGSFGTPAFMPPEQALGHTELIDPKSDLWSLGATLFTLISGRRVHEGTTVNEQLLSAMTQPAPPLEMVAPCVTPEVAALVDRALSRDKSARFEDALSMQQAVREAYDALPDGFDDTPTVVVSEMARPTSPPSSRPDGNRPSQTRTVPPMRATPSRSSIPSLGKHLAVLASAGVGFLFLAAFYLFRSESPGPSPPVTTTQSPAPPAMPARVLQAVATSRAVSTSPQKALSFDDLPRDIDDEEATKAQPAPAVRPGLASAMALAAATVPAMPATPSPAVTPVVAPPPAPVQPAEVHLEEAAPSPYDDPNPYDDSPSVHGRRTSAAAPK